MIVPVILDLVSFDVQVGIAIKDKGMVRFALL